ILIYGTEGVGKTQFGADGKDVVFLGSEEGTGHLANIKRFPQPHTWAEAFEAIDALIEGEHDHKTLVVDTLDWLEPLCWAHVCAQAKVKSIEDVGGGYGKGYTAAVDQWRTFLRRLDVLRERRKMEIILIAHSAVKMAKMPDSEDYERFQLAIHQ